MKPCALRPSSYSFRGIERASTLNLPKELRYMLNISFDDSLRVRMQLRGGDESEEKLRTSHEDNVHIRDVPDNIHAAVTDVGQQIELCRLRIEAAMNEKLAQDARKLAEEAAHATLKLKASIEAQEISYGELLDSPLPPLEDLSPMISSCSLAELRKIPRDVRHWPNFHDEVVNHRRNIPAAILESRPYSRLRRPNRVLVCSSEPEIQTKFSSVVCPALDEIFDETLKTTAFPSSGICQVQGLETPDFVTVRFCGVDGIVKPVAVFEIKRHNFLLYGKDLVAGYHAGKRMIRDGIFQIDGYHVAYECKYGFISTYHYTWATYLDSDGTLYISPAYNSDNGGDDSVLNMMNYVLCKASAESMDNSNKWTPPLNLEDPPPKSRKKIKVSKMPRAESDATIQTKLLKSAVQKPKPSRYRKTRVLSDVSGRLAFQALLDEYKLVVVKCYLCKEYRDNEVECYACLRELQGDSIPQLLDPDYLYPDEEKNRTYGLVISWVGSPNAGSYKMLPTTALEEARRIVVAMHERGVAHGDIQPLNMNYDFKTGKLYVFDFSHAVAKCTIGTDGFTQACFEDLCELDRLIAISKTSRARGIRYIHWPARQAVGAGLETCSPVE